jgi:type VI secretion system secreted protein VgrG
MPTWAQDPRLLELNTPLGKDVLLLAKFTGEEAMSRLFRYQLDTFSTKPDINPSSIVGKNVTWSVKHHNSEPRFFNGFVSRFGVGARTIQDLYVYTMEVVPGLWFLTRTANCKIYSGSDTVRTAPEIIKKVFEDQGFNDYKMDLQRTYEKREFCVQYRETAFNYVSHIMEEEGIYYFFQHQNGKHTMVLSDNKGSYKDVQENQVRYTAGDVSPNHLTAWGREYEFRPGKWTHTDYNFEIPSTSLLATTNTVVPTPGVSKYEMFDYPGDYPQKPEGDAEVKVRMEEEEKDYDVVTASSENVTMNPGGKFTISEHDKQAEAGKSYVVTSINHSGIDTSYAGKGRSTYTNTFTAIPDKTTFRPPRVTPRPVINGTQPAVVVGPKGQELYTDKYGRVKVQFYWDRVGQRDENSSCWIRVSQNIAGKRWGISFWPRIGQEVIVGFYEGDPDRPLIVGMVYNGEQMPPYQGGGPDGKHANDNKVTGYKSNTTMGGVGFNEWRFDDTKGAEQVFIHAERNMDVRVKKDSMLNIDENKHMIVGKDQKEKIKGNMEHLVVGNQDQVTSGTKKELVEGDNHEHVKGVHNEKVDGKVSLNFGQDLHEKIGMGWAHESGMTVYIKAGMSIVLEAGMQISLKVGGNFVDISMAGVAINGMPTVLINSGGAPGSGSAPSPTDPDDANKAEPTEADDSKTGQKSAP